MQMLKTHMGLEEGRLIVNTETLQTTKGHVTRLENRDLLFPSLWLHGALFKTPLKKYF